MILIRWTISLQLIIIIIAMIIVELLYTQQGENNMKCIFLISNIKIYQHLPFPHQPEEKHLQP